MKAFVAVADSYWNHIQDDLIIELQNYVKANTAPHKYPKKVIILIVIIAGLKLLHFSNTGIFKVTWHWLKYRVVLFSSREVYLFRSTEEHCLATFIRGTMKSISYTFSIIQ